MKQFTTVKQIGFVDGDYNDCINRWRIKRIVKRIFPIGTELRKLKVTYLGKYELGWLKLPHNVYKIVSAEDLCKLVSMSYDSYEGGYYYELKEDC